MNKHTLFLLFNHTLTPTQKADAMTTFGVNSIVPPPGKIRKIWEKVPSNISGLEQYLNPVCEWLERETKQGDFVLVHGDFGACYLMVQFALTHNLVPIYSTTNRDSIEEQLDDESVKTVHHFHHVMFRKYGL